MKETLLNTQTGDRMVRRVALTRSGVKVSTFVASNINDTGALTAEELDILNKTDVTYMCSSVVSEQTNWLDVSITVYNKVALYKPTLEIINAFSENSKILIMAGHNIVKTFDIGGLTGTVEFDFLANDELINNPEDPEDTSQYFKSSGFKMFDADGLASPIILNPYSVNAPLTATVNIVGNTNPAASGVFKMTVIALND